MPKTCTELRSRKLLNISRSPSELMKRKQYQSLTPEGEKRIPLETRENSRLRKLCKNAHRVENSRTTAYLATPLRINEGRCYGSLTLEGEKRIRSDSRENPCRDVCARKISKSRTTKNLATPLWENENWCVWSTHTKKNHLVFLRSQENRLCKKMSEVDFSETEF